MNCNAAFSGLLTGVSTPDSLTAPLPLEPLRLSPAATVQQQLYMNTLLHQFNPVQNPFFVAQLQLANAFKANQSIFPNTKEKELNDNDENHKNLEYGMDFPHTLDLTKPRSETRRTSDNDQSIVTDDEVLDKIKGKDITVSRIQCKDDLPLDDQDKTKPLSNSNGAKLLTSSLKQTSSSIAHCPVSSENFGRDTATSPQAVTFSPEPTGLIQVTDKTAPLPADPALIMKALVSVRQRKPRGQKKPIPDEMKTARYYERRSRNNRAAKKSRDQRKLRESLITQRAAFLEAENAHFRLKIAEFKKQLLAINMILAERGIDPSSITAEVPNAS